MNLHKKLVFAIIIFLSFLTMGTLTYSFIEGWKYLDSIYFVVATVTTLGYGDFVPLTNIGKIFTMFFSFFGIGMAFYFFSLFAKYIYKKTFQGELKEHHEKIIKHHEKVIKSLKSHVHKNYQLKRK